MENEIFAIIGALDAEIDEYVKHLKDLKTNRWKQFVFYEGHFARKRVVICKSGVGKVFAALTTQKVIDTYNPALIIFTGVAGALNTKLQVGDIVVADDCVQHDLDARELGFPRGAIPYTGHRFFHSDKHLKSLAMSAPTQHAMYEGRILTGDQFLTQSVLKGYEYLTEELQGDAVEMEGASVGQVCTVNEVPFLVIRTISDKADENASIHFNEFLPVVAKNSFQMVDHMLKNYRHKHPVSS
jgi:5'-methylthioadenosine/S-adenosylhomocysteine nucleosidase